MALKIQQLVPVSGSWFARVGIKEFRVLAWALIDTDDGTQLVEGIINDPTDTIAEGPEIACQVTGFTNYYFYEPEH